MNAEVVAMKKLKGVEWKKATEVFGIEDKELEFDVPVFILQGEHVPDIDPNYEFRAEYLGPALWALINNKKMWISGHTGTGKSTLIKQICARLNWQMIRVNFDSEITRMDLVGRDVLKKDPSGATISEFEDGILPQALSGPYVLLCDEVDFMRADVAYVFQRALEDEGLLISEDGGRVIHPNEWSRIVATGNTQGQGDDFGLYQGARPQSMAFLDRFTVWIMMKYLSPDKEQSLLKKSVKGLKKGRLKDIMRYIQEHRQSFVTSQIMQPLSPRTAITLAESVVFYDKLLGPKEGLKKAAEYCLINKANTTDANAIRSILDRIEKESEENAEDEKEEEIAF